MTQLLVALTVFLITHLVTAVPGVRDGLVARLGLASYIIIYSAISVLTLAWLVFATLQAPSTPIWHPAGWQAWVTLVLSPLALFLILAGLFSPNALSLSLLPVPGRKPGAIVAVTRHPVFWGVLLWALSHIPPNGDVRSIALFGTLALLAASGFVLGDRRARRTLGERWLSGAEQTSIVPFAAIAQGRARFQFDLPLLAALAVTALLTGWLLYGGHAALFGADPITATRY